MKQVFADTGFWIALLNTKDRWHEQAIAINQDLQIQKITIVTSELVLIELLNFFSKFSSNIRHNVGLIVQDIQAHPSVTIVAQTNLLFTKALELYLQRQDKEWSLTDCSSFVIMRELRITEALAYDRHFQQAGFMIILDK
jgi:predicted nucleic acid-binding protein